MVAQVKTWGPALESSSGSSSSDRSSHSEATLRDRGACTQHSHNNTHARTSTRNRHDPCDAQRVAHINNHRTHNHSDSMPNAGTEQAWVAAHKEREHASTHHQTGTLAFEGPFLTQRPRAQGHPRRQFSSWLLKRRQTHRLTANPDPLHAHNAYQTTTKPRGEPQ